MKLALKMIGLISMLVLGMSAFAGDAPAQQAETKPTTSLLTVDRLYSDKNGESHWDRVTVDFKLFQYANDVPPVWVDAGGKRPAKSIGFMAAPTGWDGRAIHPPPARQFFIVLTGSVAFTASDGENKIFQPGQVILLEDNKGKGHGSYNAGQGVAQVVAIPLAD